MSASFGNLVRRGREDAGLSQSRLATLVGRSASTIRAWEHGRTNPSDRQSVVALAAVLGLDENELLGRAGFEGSEPRTPVSARQELTSLSTERTEMIALVARDGHKPAGSSRPPAPKHSAVVADVSILTGPAPEDEVVEMPLINPATMAPGAPALEVMAPEVRAPEVRAPEVRAPEVRAPEVRAPGAPALEVMAPEVRAPEVTAPEVTAPEVVRAPEVTAPEGTAPAAPKVTAPEVTAPEVTAPAAPEVTAPVVTVPVVTVPAVTVPAVTAPDVSKNVISASTEGNALTGSETPRAVERSRLATKPKPKVVVTHRMAPGPAQAGSNGFVSGISYIEDEAEKDFYRLRGAITAVVLVFMVIVIWWAFGRTGSAIGDFFESIIGSLDI